ncbi:MAG: mechanosensitive ion channel protein MscS [Alphaproteobacteria bacterium CG_4_10_14_0_8_um_filter_53_9]|nr:MAG: mechanosensitive ion channel protein MscS [Alphaproteobacteria bacterium CG_4_10_14_0_8_um_filter_53_9]
MEGLVPGLDKLMDTATTTVNTLTQDRAQAEKVISTLTEQGIHMLFNFGAAITIMVVGWILSAWVARLVQHGFSRTKMEETYASFLGSVGKYTTVFLAVLWALTFLGLNSNGMVAILGAAGIAIALSLKDFLTHIAAGVMLMVTRPFRVGDYIESSSVAGSVKRVTLFNTEVNTLYNQRVFIPNGNIWGNALINHTYNTTRQVEVKVGVSYDDAIPDVKACIEKTLKDMPIVLETPEPFIGIFDLADSSIVYLVRFWVKKSDYSLGRYGVLENIKASLDAAGFEIPYPHQVEVIKGVKPENKTAFLERVANKIEDTSSKASPKKAQKTKPKAATKKTTGKARGK